MLMVDMMIILFHLKLENLLLHWGYESVGNDLL